MNKSGLVKVSATLGLLASMTLLTSPAVAAPGADLSVKSMKISLWPEYDDPRVMVKYEGEFKDGSVFPQSVEFPVPLGTEMTMVCALKPPNDEHLCQLYDTTTETGAIDVSYTLPIPTYYLEYYWDGIKAQTGKLISYEYVSPYAVDSLEVEVQQPLRATDFNLTQPYASVTTDGLGMKYYHYVFNNVTPGQVINIDASYAKPDDRPSVSKNSNGTVSAGAGGGPNTNLLIILGILIFAGIAGYMVLGKKRTASPVRVSARQARMASRGLDADRFEPPRSRRHPDSRSSKPAHGMPGPAHRAVEGNSPASFCFKCGAKLAPEAAFCHVCGTKTVTAA